MLMMQQDAPCPVTAHYGQVAQTIGYIIYSIGQSEHKQHTLRIISPQLFGVNKFSHLKNNTVLLFFHRKKLLRRANSHLLIQVEFNNLNNLKYLFIYISNCFRLFRLTSDINIWVTTTEPKRRSQNAHQRNSADTQQSRMMKNGRRQNMTVWN